MAEMLGYLRGYTNAAQFRAVGCNTWNANANERAQMIWADVMERKREAGVIQKTNG